MDAACQAWAQTIAREAAGNPLFVLELAQHVLGGAELTGPAEEVTLERVLRARVGAVLPEAPFTPQRETNA